MTTLSGLAGSRSPAACALNTTPASGGAGKTVTRATLAECRPTASMLTDLRMVFWRMTVPEISNGGATRHHGRMCLVLKGSNELEVGPGGVDDTGLWTRCLGCETSHVHDDTDLVTARLRAHDHTVQ